MMTAKNKQQLAAASNFVEKWTGHGYEKGETQPFWLELLQKVLLVDDPYAIVEFEDKVMDTTTGFMDVYFPSTHVLIEQKSIDKNLGAPIRQSDGTLLTPFQQAKRYSADLPYSRRPRWVVTCNFAEFWVYDMEQPNGEPQKILLKDLPKEYYRLQFLVDSKSEHITKEIQVSIQAGEIVGRIYDALLKQYNDPSPKALRWLNILCVRIVFCLYAEDAGVFAHDQFHDYLARYDAEDLRSALIRLFDTLNKPQENRSKYLKDDLKAFPYTNGGLFAEEIEIPQFTDELKQTLLENASLDFDWSEISPTIFGAVFESTLNPETRRSGGMHYTSIENIHKVIDPLFLNDLRHELDKILEEKVERERRKKLDAYQNKISSLTFLDPACGSGNFLTETYLSLRRLENEVINARHHGQSFLGFEEANPIKVSINQFYGIEINDFAVTVATTALWISEAQMLHETEKIIHRDIDFLPLKSYSNIREGNALRMDWNFITYENGIPDKLPPKTFPTTIAEPDFMPEEIKREQIRPNVDIVTYSEPPKYPGLLVMYDYIIGNPPFVGARQMSPEQKKDVISIFGEKWKNVGNLDYVSCWYMKAFRASRIGNPHIALVSTNSICQGEQVANMWKPLKEHGLQIDFAYRTFRWDSEASLKAHVHCVIVGFHYDDAENPGGTSQNPGGTFENPGGKFQSPVGISKNHVGKSQNHVETFEKPYMIFDGDAAIPARHINAYLMDAPDVWIGSRSKPLCNVPPLLTGSQRIDNELFMFTDEEKDMFIQKEPASAPYFHKWYGAEEFINNRSRWVLYLGKCSPSELRNMKYCMEIICEVRKYRLDSKRIQTLRAAETPNRFGLEVIPDSDFMVIPVVSSERRRYIPIGFMSPDVMCSNQVNIIPDATLYHFGVLTSNVHMAWMRAVCGRLKSDYRYSKDIVYNNFPWPTPTDAQKAKIEQTAQLILDARAHYPDNSLADIYDELTMPSDLRKAHQDNDRAVMEAYGFDIKTTTESICVAELFKLYKKMAAV